MPGDWEIMRVDRPSLACRKRIIYALKTRCARNFMRKKSDGVSLCHIGKNKKILGMRYFLSAIKLSKNGKTTLNITRSSCVGWCTRIVNAN